MAWAGEVRHLFFPVLIELKIIIQSLSKFLGQSWLPNSCGTISFTCDKKIDKC